MRYDSLQELWTRKRKRGWVTCDNCGMSMNLSDKDICKEHINKKGCAKDRRFWGLKQNEKFPNNDIDVVEKKE